MTDAARDHAHEQLPRTRRRNRALIDRERFAEFVDHGRAHHVHEITPGIRPEIYPRDRGRGIRIST
jgi:hypothetical protein